MKTECAECDRPATQFHGMVAYCHVHITEAQEKDPDAHKCITCGRTQPAHVHWERKAPCGSCLANG